MAHISSVAHDHSDPSVWGLQENGAFSSIISKAWLRVMWCSGAGAVEQAHESWVTPVLGTDVVGRGVDLYEAWMRTQKWRLCQVGGGGGGVPGPPSRGHIVLQ
jgi:hypothetical protein